MIFFHFVIERYRSPLNMFLSLRRGSALITRSTESSTVTRIMWRNVTRFNMNTVVKGGRLEEFYG